jgi:tryptophan synthase alpha chain
MKNRITALFETGKKDLLSIYFTAGYPALQDTCTIIETLASSGVDMIEIGIPFSDPLADGPTIQRSSEKALLNGMTLRVLFEQLKDIRKTVQIPLLLMGYINPIIQYGIANFCKKCKEIGIDGIIVPDLPLSEYLNEYEQFFKENDLCNIFLVTPQSAEGRIREIDRHSSGFIYLVSSAATTGNNAAISKDQEAYFKRIQALNLKNPLMIGFGISDHASFASAASSARGAIIGSAFIKALTEGKDLQTSIPSFVNMVLNQ